MRIRCSRPESGNSGSVLAKPSNIPQRCQLLIVQKIFTLHPPVTLHHGGESPGDVLVGQGGVDHPRGKGGGGEEGGGNEDGGGDEKGEESPMDGLIGWTRLGKKRRVP